MTPGAIRRNLMQAWTGDTIAVITSTAAYAEYLFKAHLDEVAEWVPVSVHMHSLKLVFPEAGSIVFKYRLDQTWGCRFDHVVFDELSSIPTELIERVSRAKESER